MGEKNRQKEVERDGEKCKGGETERETKKKMAQTNR